MEVIDTPLKDCFVIKVPVYGDNRGFFLESFNQRKLKEKGIDFEVKQVNFAKSEQNVLRGLHYQEAPNAQSKLVGVINGAVLDVVVDIRPESPTYLKHYKIILDSNDTFLLVPKGFAHGYHTLQDDTIFYYAVDQFYAPDSENGIRFDDQKLGINWELRTTPKISEKDLNQPFLNI